MPPLVIFGNPGGKSEKAAWEKVCKIAEELREIFAHDLGATKGRLPKKAMEIEEIAKAMLQQVKKGIHRNPHRKRTVMSHDVEAIIYNHAVDGTRRVHGYGNADITPKDLPGGGIQILGLKDRTGVSMYGNDDGTVTICCANGDPVWAMVEDH